MFDSYSDDQMSEIEPDDNSTRAEDPETMYCKAEDARDAMREDGIYSYNEVYASEVEAWRQEQIENNRQDRCDED